MIKKEFLLYDTPRNDTTGKENREEGPIDDNKN